MSLIQKGERPSDEEQKAVEERKSVRDKAASEDEEERQAPRGQPLFTNLINALRPSSGGKEFTYETFAACETITPSHGFSLPSFYVEGAGEFQLPLAVKDTSRLRGVCERVKFGNVRVSKVRRCWQVDASKVSFPGMPAFLSETILPLAMEAVGALGLDGAGMQAQISKLLFYEAGGHFTFRRDTEKNKEVTAILLVQLLTEEDYKGGQFAIIVLAHAVMLIIVICTSYKKKNYVWPNDRTG